MLIFCVFIQVCVFTTNHHLNLFGLSSRHMMSEWPQTDVVISMGHHDVALMSVQGHVPACFIYLNQIVVRNRME